MGDVPFRFPACNANCVGCISLQPDEEPIVSTQDRLTFLPTRKRSLNTLFLTSSQLLFLLSVSGKAAKGTFIMWETIRDAVVEIRKHTSKGSININTNGSKPDAVKILCEAVLTQFA
jgi:hypothetical protein